MNPEVLSAILHEDKLAYLVTDDSFMVRQMFDPAHLITDHVDECFGRSLLDLAPELVGNEEALRELCAGRLARFDLGLINRVDAEGKTRYHRILLTPRQFRRLAGLSTEQSAHAQRCGIIYLVEDVSEMGEMQQRLMQSRNDLLLLRDALDAANRDLAAANVELRKAADLKTSLVSIAAHELRTPLAIICGYAEILLAETLGALAEPQREGLSTIRQSSERLLEIVNNLLDLQRIEAGRIELILQSLDLRALLWATVKEYRPLFEAAGQELIVSAEPDLPAALLDEARAFQILGNLLSNASRYTQQGGRVDVRLELAETLDELLVIVRDNGVGIPADEQDRLCDRFFRARTANLVSAHGAGLGLYITNSLVQLHGGRLWFESVEGQGTTFYVTFLVADPGDW